MGLTSVNNSLVVKEREGQEDLAHYLSAEAFLHHLLVIERDSKLGHQALVKSVGTPDDECVKQFDDIAATRGLPRRLEDRSQDVRLDATGREFSARADLEGHQLPVGKSAF